MDRHNTIVHILPRSAAEEDGVLRVGGSGIADPTYEEKGQDRIEVYYEAPSKEDRETEDHLGHMPMIHNFTWTADPKFVVKEHKFTYEEWAAKLEMYSRLDLESFMPKT